MLVIIEGIYNTTQNCEGIDEIKKVFSLRYDHGELKNINTYYFRNIASSYPYLQIEVSGDYAHLGYFESEECRNVMQSFDNEKIPDFDCEYDFLIGGSIVKLINVDIVPIEKAIEAVYEFSQTGEMPLCIAWTET